MSVDMSEDRRSNTKCVPTLLSSVSDPFLFHAPSLLDFKNTHPPSGPPPQKQNHLKSKFFVFNSKK